MKQIEMWTDIGRALRVEYTDGNLKLTVANNYDLKKALILLWNKESVLLKSEHLFFSGRIKSLESSFFSEGSETFPSLIVTLETKLSKEVIEAIRELVNE